MNKDFYLFKFNNSVNQYQDKHRLTRDIIFNDYSDLNNTPEPPVYLEPLTDPIDETDIYTTIDNNLIIETILNYLNNIKPTHQNTLDIIIFKIYYQLDNTHQQYNLNKDKITITDISETLKLSMMTVHRSIKRIEKKIKVYLNI